MKKKFLSFVFALCLVIPCAFLLSACGGKKNNDEFLEFKAMAQSIIAQYKVDESASATALTMAPARMMSTKLMSAQNSQSIDDLIKNNGNKVDTINHYYASFLDIAFYSPLAVGDVITEKNGAKEFYGITVQITDGFDGYLQVDKNGTHTYIYAVGFNGGGDYLTYVDVDYTSQSDYEINGYVSSPENDYFSYIYLDSDFNFMSVEKLDEGYAATSNGSSHYKTTDPEIINQVCDLIVSNETLETYKQKASSITSSNQYSITKASMESALSKYYAYEPTEGDYALTHGYIVKDGVVETVNLEDQDFNLKTIVLPRSASVDTIRYDLNFASCVKKVVIPANIKHIKFDSGTDYDDFYMGSWVRNERMDTGIEFIIEEGSTLFKKENGNCYVNCDGEWKIFQLCNETIYENETVTLDNNGMNFENVTGNVQTYFRENGYPAVKNLVLTNSIDDLARAYSDGNKNITLDTLICASANYNQERILNYMNEHNTGFGIKRIKKLIIDNSNTQSFYHVDLGAKDNQLVQIDEIEFTSNCKQINIEGYINCDVTIPSSITYLISDSTFEVEGDLIVDYFDIDKAYESGTYQSYIDGIVCSGQCTLNIPFSEYDYEHYETLWSPDSYGDSPYLGEWGFSFRLENLIPKIRRTVSEGIIADGGIVVIYTENIAFNLSDDFYFIGGRYLKYDVPTDATTADITDFIVEQNGFTYKLYYEQQEINVGSISLNVNSKEKNHFSIVATNESGDVVTYKIDIVIPD